MKRVMVWIDAEGAHASEHESYEAAWNAANSKRKQGNDVLIVDEQGQAFRDCSNAPIGKFHPKKVQR